MNHQQYKQSITLLLYIGACLLLIEWISPLREVSGMQGTTSFIVFVALSLLLYFFQVPRVWRALLKCLFVVWALHHYYYVDSIIQMEWIGHLTSDLVNSVKYLVSGQWEQISNVSRSVLFFLLLWLITYLIKYWLYHKKNLFLFFILTVFYLCALDTFTPFQASHAIVSCMTIGFLVLGLNHLYRHTASNNILNIKLLVSWLSGVLVFLAIGLVVGVGSPKASPKWPDPVPFLQSVFNQKGSAATTNEKKAGFREKDTQLGGPFQSDDRTVFTAIAPENQYWKVESRDKYTGKGWESTPDLQANESDSLLSISDYLNVASKRAGKATITFEQSSEILPYVYGTILFDNDKVKEWSADIASERMKAGYPLSSYDIYYRKPVFSLKKLNATAPKDWKPKENYLQLPSTLPDRIKSLAEKITKGQRTWYRKAKSIEEYFQSNGFTYDKQNVAVPNGKTDYVDQFLFDTKTGYCDNFSTSMVVMLRTLGIPSRWAKGYYAGAFDQTVGNNQNQYTITNNDAHSWVEVQIPDVGWVPFEPTIGYQSNIDVVDDDQHTSAEQDTKEDKPVIEEKENKNKDQTAQAATQAQKKETVKENKTKNKGKRQHVFHYSHWQILCWIIGIVIVIGGLLYFTRSKWIAYLLKRKIEKVKDIPSFIRTYESMMSYCQLISLKKEKGQTFRQYAMVLDERFGTNQLKELTDIYDRLMYSKQIPNIEWAKIRELFKDFINATSG